MKMENEEEQLLLQRLLGQLLFYPPNVAGWPGGANWIDSSTLLFRLRIPQLMYDSSEFRLRPKEDDDQLMGMKETEPQAAAHTGPGQARAGKGKSGGVQMIRVDIDWAPYLKGFDKIPDQQLFAAISGVVLQTPAGLSETMLKKYTNAVSRQELIKSTTIRLMSTPEYQLC
jgi:hypothetical protein